MHWHRLCGSNLSGISSSDLPFRVMKLEHRTFQEGFDWQGCGRQAAMPTSGHVRKPGAS